MRVALLFLTLAALDASCALAQEDGLCTDVDPGSLADACSELQDKLEIALVQNPTNIYTLRKAFSKPTPALLNVVYNISITNMPPKVKANYSCMGNGNETSNDTCNIMISRDNIWTDISLFTTLHPGIIQQLQLQFPYFMLGIAEWFIKEDASDNFVLRAAQWDGCSGEDTSLPSIPLSLALDYDNLSHNPSEELLHSSVQELTTWLQAYENIQPHVMPLQRRPEIDKDFVLRSEPVRQEHEDIVINVEIGGGFIILVMCLSVLTITKCTLKRKEDKGRKDPDPSAPPDPRAPHLDVTQTIATHPVATNSVVTQTDKTTRITKFFSKIHTPALLYVASYNSLVLIFEIVSLRHRLDFTPAAGCYLENHSHVVVFRLVNIVLTGLAFYIIAFIHILFLKKYIHSSPDSNCIKVCVTCLKLITAIFTDWTKYIFILFFSKSVIVAFLLAYAYPFAVVTTALLMITSAVFLLLLFCYLFLGLKNFEVREHFYHCTICCPELISTCCTRGRFTQYCISTNTTTESQNINNNNIELGELSATSQVSEQDQGGADVTASATPQADVTVWCIVYHICVPVLILGNMLLIAVVNIGLLAPFAVAIVKRQVDFGEVTGVFLSLLTSVIFGVGSWFLKNKIENANYGAQGEQPQGNPA